MLLLCVLVFKYNNCFRLDMSGIVDVAKLARGTLLPPVESIEGQYNVNAVDRSLFVNQAIQTVCNIKNLLSTTVWPDQADSDSYLEIIPLLLLCGEHSIKADWNTDSLVDAVKDILTTVCHRLGVRDVAILFSLKKLASLVIKELLPKLGRDNFKQNPASIQSFLWVATHLKVIAILNSNGLFKFNLNFVCQHPDVDELVGAILPVTLRLVDDYEAENQRKGLVILSHILPETVSLTFFPDNASYYRI